MAIAIQTGDKVRLTRAYLKATGQRTRGEGGKVWTVRACDCALCEGGQMVAVDEATGDRWYMPEELAADPRLTWRHISRGAIYVKGRLDTRNAD